MISCSRRFKILMSYTIICRHILKICKLDCENVDKKVFNDVNMYMMALTMIMILLLFVCTGHWNYTHTIRRPKIRGQVIEVKTQLSHRDYVNLLSQKDETHYPIYKKRRCFIHFNQYFQLDIYCKPCHPRYVTIVLFFHWTLCFAIVLFVWPTHNTSYIICCVRCEGLVLLETYSALEDQELLDRLPKFLDIEAEVTGNSAYSMFNLSLVEEWDKSKNFCHYLKGTDNF